MRSILRSRPRRMAWRRIAVGVGLIALTLSLTAVPSATASTGQAAPRAVTVMPPLRIPSSGEFLPPWIRGDRDFAGHGPRVFAEAHLGVTGGGKRLVVTFYMQGVETQPNWTTVQGESSEYLIFLAPGAECIQSVNIGTYAEIIYTDDDHDNDLLPGLTGSFVSVWNFVGDTPGNEAGTETGFSIGTNGFTVTTAPC